jgi:SAM-dependent methyltransferase
MKLFALLYDLIMLPVEWLVLRRLRARVVREARGRILEIGIGTWLNLPHYAADRVERLVGLEPDDGMLRKARRRADQSSLRLQITRASAEEMPFADASFDTIVATLVSCTVPDPLRALQECRRVLAPGGELRLLEHGRSARPHRAFVQRFFSSLWRRLFGGCHLDRDVLALVLQAGFLLRDVSTRDTWRLCPAFCLHELVASGDSEATPSVHVP